jgi:hypothetical protein
MSSLILKSFTAFLELPGTHLNFLGTLYGKPALATPTFGNGTHFSGRPKTYDDSAFLGHRPTQETGPVEKLKLYFWYTANGYEVYVMDNNPLPSLRLSIRRSKIAGAVDRDLDDLDTFNLLNKNDEVITLDDLKDGPNRVKIQVVDGGLLGSFILRGSSYTYIADIRSGHALTFNLSVAETHYADS